MKKNDKEAILAMINMDYNRYVSYKKFVEEYEKNNKPFIASMERMEEVNEKAINGLIEHRSSGGQYVDFNQYYYDALGVKGDSTERNEADAYEDLPF